MKRVSAFSLAKRAVGSVALLALVLLMNVVPVSAQQKSSSGLSITPRKNLNVKPGQTIEDKLSIGNLNATQDLNITFSVVDFTFKDETGTPKLNLAKDAPQLPWSVKPFIQLPGSVVVPAGASKSVPYKVTVPAGQGAGSYYSAIQYATSRPEGGNVSLSASGVSLVFVSVPGIAKEEMTLKKFGAYALDKDVIVFLISLMFVLFCLFLD